MAAAAILKIQVNDHNSVAIACIYTKFGSERKTDILETEIPSNFIYLKIQDGGRPSLWKRINRHNSAAKFHQICYGDRYGTAATVPYLSPIYCTYSHKIWLRKKNRHPGNRNTFKFYFSENPFWIFTLMAITQSLFNILSKTDRLAKPLAVLTKCEYTVLRTDKIVQHNLSLFSSVHFNITANHRLLQRKKTT